MSTIRFGSTLSGALLWTVPRLVSQVPIIVPKPPTEPPPTMIAKATIVSYEASITVGQTARAVAKLTQGSPTAAWFQWQYQDGFHWENANLHRNPATDLDHHYALAFVGSFPIRLQTWDAPTGGHMTDQTGTARTITVKPAVSVPPPQPVPLPPPSPVPGFQGALSTSGTTFRNPSGQIVHLRGITAFTAYQLWLDGHVAQLEDYVTYTHSIGAWIWRVFGMWTVTGFTPKNRSNYYSQLRPFADWLRARGIHLHFTLFCDQDPKSASKIVLDARAQSDHYHQVSEAFSGADNVIAELVNEDWQNGQIAHLFGLVNGSRTTRSAFQDGKPYTQPGLLLQFTNEHTPRTWDWMRKAKNLLETARLGLGTIAPPSGVPAICAEPIGVFEQNQPGRRTNSPRDCGDYFALAELTGAGAYLHGDMTSLMTCQRPGPVGQQCALAAAAAWAAAIPADAASTGQYTRGGLGDCPLAHRDRYDDDGHEVDTAGALRTFAMLQGTRATAVVVRPGSGYNLQTQHGWVIERTAGSHNQVVFLRR